MEKVHFTFFNPLSQTIETTSRKKLEKKKYAVEKEEHKFSGFAQFSFVGFKLKDLIVLKYIN